MCGEVPAADIEPARVDEPQQDQGTAADVGNATDNPLEENLRGLIGAINDAETLRRLRNFIDSRLAVIAGKKNKACNADASR